MRAYFFVNSWLSSIQKGLQVAHCVAEMANKALVVESWPREAKEIDPTRVAKHDDYCDWANDHKTIVVLEGGSHADLLEILSFILEGQLMCASVKEDQESLAGAMTCVGIIVPQKIYEAAKEFREGRAVLGAFTSWELKFIDLINSKELAR